MKTTHKITFVVLVLSLCAAAYGLFETSRPVATAVRDAKGNPAVTAQKQAPLVDQTPLKTAQQLAQLATTPEERPLAQEALRIADREVNLAFAAALRDAAEHPPVLGAEAKGIEQRLQQTQKLLKNDEARVAQLTAAMAKAADVKKDALQDELELAKAQAELDQDEVDDAKQDLIRAGGDPEDRIQQLVQEHEAAAHGTASVIPNGPAPPEELGLIHRFQQWSALHQKQMQLWNAKGQAESAAAALSAQHSALDARVDLEKSSTPELAHHAKRAKSAESPFATPPQVTRSREEAAALVARTKHIASEQKALAIFDKQIDAHKDLADLYSRWVAHVAVQQRVVLNRALRGILIILTIAVIALFFSSWMDKIVGRLSMDRRQVQSLHTVTRVSLQVIALLLILLVIFGPPGQLGTFLGLAGAGLTVALKDFIVGFIGWFVLMGKNGIRLGDWVEINGVTGEVVQIGPFHTVLLETGNWTDSGHPTGRRVTFTNSFAIEGHYFNFSTTGQWLWDELQVVLPAGQDPYPMVDAIRKKVLEATQETAEQAAQEWRRSTNSRDMGSISVAPAISVKPVVGGIEVAVRYITRANERYLLRAKLYQAAVELLGGKNVKLPPPSEAKPAPNPT